MKKRIVVVTGGGQGGAQRMALLYTKILQKVGFDCLLVICHNNTNSTLLNLIPKDLPYKYIISRYRYLFFKLLFLLRKEQPAVVFAAMPSFIPLLSIIRIFHLCRFSLISRCINTPSKMIKKEYSYYKKWIRFSDLIISQTKEMRKEIVEHFYVEQQKITIINNPIDSELIKEKILEPFSLDHNYINYVAVGRLHEQKGYKTLLKAFAEILNIEPKSRLYILGEAQNQEYAMTLHAITSDYNMEDNVFFEGFQNNPYKYVNEADVFCLSSNYEGLPNVMLEAMFLGKPVVATTCIPYIAQVIENGVNGYTVPVGDCSAFAKAMIMANNLKHCKKMTASLNSESKIISVFKSFINSK